MSRFKLVAFALILGFIPAGVMAGPIWPEGAAGRMPSSAEPVTVPVTHITGALTGSAFRGVDANDYEDMYQIRILDPRDCGGKGFTANTTWMVTPGGINDFNTQLWLFDATGRGLLGNDDAGIGVPQSFISFPANDLTLQPFTGPGIYYLAITGFNDDPLSPGGPIFNQASPFEISGPDGPGAPLPINNWSANGTSDIGLYDIELECVGAVPEPAACSLVLVGVALALTRRGRRLP